MGANNVILDLTPLLTHLKGGINDGTKDKALREKKKLYLQGSIVDFRRRFALHVLSPPQSNNRD